MKSLFILLTALFTSVLTAQSPAPGDAVEIRKSFIEELNDIRNLKGLNFDFIYKGEIFSNFSGGMESKSTYLDNFDIIMNIDFEGLVGWKGAKLNTHILGNHGGDPSEYAGAEQGISNIAAYETWKLYQFWFEQNLFDNKIFFLAGLYDLNSEFDSRETSGIFINPSHGIGAEYALTGRNGPSIFPNTSLALRVKYNFSPSADFKAAVFDAVPGDPNKPGGTHIQLKKDEGFLLSAEINLKSESEEFNSMYFKYAVGGWYYTGKFEKFQETNNPENPLLQKGNYGLYVSAEKFLFSESENPEQGLAGFFRIGIADKNVNQVDAYYGAGLSYTGLIPGRDDDAAGFAIASAQNNRKYINLMSKENFRVEGYEHILELTYLLNLTGYLKIQPDLQYVINPANCNCHTYSFLYGTRVEFAL